MAKVWQHPYLNIFKHFKVEEWKRSTKDGDVTTFMDKTLKGTVYRINGAVPASNYLQLPKTGTQSLGLTGQYIYILFKPAPGKYFVVHLDVATEDSQVVRISFSNLFKEFKSTATWLQFPYICGATRGSVYESTAKTSKRDLVGLAPSNVRWTCLMLGLRHVLGLYLNRTYSHLKSVKLCSNMLVKNLFPSNGSKMPFDSIQKSTLNSYAVTQVPKDVSLSKPVRDRVSLIQQITSPKEMPRQSPLLTKHIPKIHPSRSEPVWTACLVDQCLREGSQGRGDSCFPPSSMDDGSIHVYAHKNGDGRVGAVTVDSDEALWASGSGVVVYPCHALIVAVAIDSGKQRFFAGHTDKVVVVWNTIQVNCGGEVVTLAKAHTDVDIRAFKIAFFDDTRFVCSRSGHVVEIDYKNVTVKNVRRLLPLETGPAPQREKTGFNSGPGISLNSICLSSSFCATASDDGYLRLWPLDFSEVFLEAEHNNPVSSVRISPDNLKVLCTTAAGNVGCLDIQSRDYYTIMRSHVGTVWAFSVDSSQKQLVTVSKDSTIRIWNVESLQQLYEFTASDEIPCAVAFHPFQPIFACGFDTGVVRTISLAASRLLEEHKQHRGLITGLTFSPDGNFMYSSCTQGTLSLYNCAVQKTNVVSQDADHGPDALSVSCEGRLLAFVGPSKYIVTLMDAHTLDELLRIDVSILDLDSTALDAAVRLCFAPFSLGHLLVSTSSQKVLVLDAKTGRLIRVVFIGHSEPIQQVRFTPDQKQVLSVGDAIFLWDFLGVFAEEPFKDEIDSPGPLVVPQVDQQDEVEISPPGSSDAPRQLVPLPTVVSPPCLDLSALHRLVEQDTWSDSEEEAACLKGKNGEAVNGTTDHSVLVLNDVVQHEEPLPVKPDLTPLSSSPHSLAGGDEGKETKGSVPHNIVPPDCYRHFIPRFKSSAPSKVLASASGQDGGDLRCQICIWNVQNRTCEKVLFHHDNQVQAMAYSQDDRFLVTLGDYVDRVVALWNTQTYDLMTSTRLAEPVHDLAFNPLSVGQLACVGKGAVTFWLMKQQGSDISLKVQRVPAPDAVGVLQCRHNRLVSGSNTKKIQIWSVAAVQELRVKGSDARSNSVLLEQEITLDGTIVSAAFDDGMDMGIVGTTAGTLWYISWTENTSIRLISGHKNKVSEVAFSPGESHFATCAEDGSVRSCLCLAWSPVPTSINGVESHHIVAGYSDGTIRLFSISRTEMELKMHPHSLAVMALGYSADGEIILSGSKDGLIAINSPRTGMTIRVLTDHRPSAINYKELGAEGSDLWLASSSDRRVSVWISDWLKDKCEIIDWLSFPAPTGPEIPSPLPPSLAAFCPWDKSTIAYVGFGLQKEILFYSLQQKQVLETIPLPSFATSLSLSPVACTIAVGFSECMLRLIDRTTRTSEDYGGHNDTVCLCRFAPSGKRLFTASYNEILVWEVQSR
ncbi:hypothetical protein Chor_015112 [Crotalus horridus]